MSRCNPEANSPSSLKRKASSTFGRGKVANLNTNFNFSAWSDEYVTLYLGDSLHHYDNWERPTVIVSDGAYGILGFEGDTSDHIDLPNWYKPHIEARVRASQSCLTKALENLHHIVIIHRS
ncbi:hypothetical protein QUA36_28745, partial [Microcoleus sp. Pol10D4]